MSDIRVGDRVRVAQRTADTYIQPYRGWIEKGRMAKVIRTTDKPWLVTLQFDCARRPKRASDYTLSRVHKDDLTLVERQGGTTP